MSAQEYLFTGAGDGTTWHDPNNWNPQVVPGSIFSTLTIPEGMTVINEDTIIFNFGNIVGGGTLVNNSVFSFSGSTALSRGVSNISIINNASLLNEVPNNPTGLSGGTTITNNLTGTITFDGLGMFSVSTEDKIINNGGTIKSIHSGNLVLSVLIENNNGTFEIENGELYLATGYDSNLCVFQDGTYNVAENATFWLGNHTLQGTFHGQVDGAFGLVGNGANILTISDTLTNELAGNGLTFYFGSLQGGGTFINNTKFNITNDGGGLGKMIQNITIINNGEFNSAFSNNNTSWGLWDGSEIYNEATGVMNIGLGFNGNTGEETLYNNGGLVLTTNDVGIGVNFINSGLFEYGPYEFTFAIGSVLVNNTIDGTFLGTGTLGLNIAQALINNGIFTSGAGASKSFIYNGYRQDEDARLVVDINGNTPETEFDVIQADFGGAFDMNGTIEVNLGFAPQIEDEFAILFSVNRAVVCGLPATISANYNGFNYVFDVICEGNSVVLKVSGIILDNQDVISEITSVYPNPSNGNFAIDFGTIHSNVSVQISNLLGQIISTETYVSTNKIENIIAGPMGAYLVKISTSDGISKTYKIIKN
jgi:hypothetical protein